MKKIVEINFGEISAIHRISTEIRQLKIFGVGEIFEGVLKVLTFFFRVKVGCSWIIKGVEHALIFKALFPGCQHGVGERVSLRGAVICCMGIMALDWPFTLD